MEQLLIASYALIWTFLEALKVRYYLAGLIQASSASKILIIGQAPGSKVHASGVPWDDPSGNQLRQWLGVGKNEFYNEKLCESLEIESSTNQESP